MYLVIKYPFWGVGGGSVFKLEKSCLNDGGGGDFIIIVCVFVFSFDHLHVTWQWFVYISATVESTIIYM